MSQRNRSGVMRTAGALTLLVVIVLLFFWFQSAPSPAPTPSPAVTLSQEGWYRVYFTNPAGPQSETLRGGPDQSLADAIDAAQYSVDMAIYDLNLWSVRDALLRAYSRGLKVRLVAESDNMADDEFAALKAAGILVVGDRRETTMHHKFVVIDQLEVWTGSMNLTVDGAYRNDNNVLRLHSQELAADYEREFEEMFISDRFGPLSLADTPYPVVLVDGTTVEAYFSPDDGVAEHLTSLVREARQTIDFMAYSFTLQQLAQAMIDQAHTGVVVRGVIERGQVGNPGSQYDSLLEGGIDVLLDGNPKNMHHKVIVIDGFSVVTGSYNFSRSAEEYNDENVLILHDGDLASQFLIEFERVYAQAE